jgi:hypothetical protein
MSSKSKGKAASSIGQLQQQPTAKKARKRKDTSEKNAPVVLDYVNAWTDTKETDQELATANSLFGAKDAWFIREQYIALYDQIASRSDDDIQSLEIVRGSLLLVLESRRSCCTRWPVFD